jgi:hypothetical protein
MSELRAPDPTLIAMAHRLVTVVEDDVVLEAHDEDCAHAWGPHLMAQSVAYQAVPCRECFPDAPPRARDPLNRPKSGMYLSWQLAGVSDE